MRRYPLTLLTAALLAVFAPLGALAGPPQAPQPPQAPPVEERVTALEADMALVKARLGIAPVVTAAVTTPSVTVTTPVVTADATYAAVWAEVAAGREVVIAVGVPAAPGVRAFPAGFLTHSSGRASGLFRCFRSALGECLFAPVEPVAESAPVGLFGGNCPGGNCGTATGWGWRR